MQATPTGFADDLSVISANKADHQSTLDTIQHHSASLDLILKPPKCLSYCFSGESSVPDLCFRLGDNHTVNVSTKPAKFLGKIIGSTPHQTKKATSQKLKDDALAVMKRIDSCTIRGEFKVWIYQNYFVPSTHFFLSDFFCVSDITPSQLASIQRQITRFLKSWLNLPKCATLASIFHPKSLGIKHLPQFRELAQLTLVQTVKSSLDPLVQDIHPIFSRLPEISAASLQAIQKARDTVSSNAINSYERRCRKAKEDLLANHSLQWEHQVSKLTVQSKLLEVTPLEQSSPVWKQLMFDLPAGQLSFLAGASVDCLPTPTSLARWNTKVSPSCPLCQQTTCSAKHILSCCKTALNQGRYTWRHDRALQIIAEFIKHHRADASVYCDLHGLRASDNPASTIPPEILPTSARPDIAIVSTGRITMVELTVPWNSEDSLASAKRYKTSKENYQLVLSDLSSQNIRAELITLEIGCLGHHTNDLFCALKHLAPHCSKSDRYQLRDNLSRSVIASSYTIFKAHRSPTWQF